MAHGDARDVVGEQERSADSSCASDKIITPLAKTTKKGPRKPSYMKQFLISVVGPQVGRVEKRMGRLIAKYD